MKKYQLKNINCASCAANIEEEVAKLEEIKFVSVSFANSSMMIVTPEPAILVIPLGWVSSQQSDFGLENY